MSIYERRTVCWSDTCSSFAFSLLCFVVAGAHGIRVMYILAIEMKWIKRFPFTNLHETTANGSERMKKRKKKKIEDKLWLSKVLAANEMMNGLAIYSYTWKEMGFFSLPVWMATVPNWHRIHRHFVPPHALRISDGPRTVADCSCPSRRPINANGRGVAAVRNIRPHRPNNPMESVGRPMVRWPVHVAMPPDIAPALSSFAIVEIIPETKWKKNQMIFLARNRVIQMVLENASFWWVFFSVHFSHKNQ